MNLVNFIFGQRHKRGGQALTAPPEDAAWRQVRPKPDQRPVRARRAEADCTVPTAHGHLRARGGEDFIVTYEPGDHAVIAEDIFQRTYDSLGGGLYRKRTDIVLRFFTLNHPVIVRTLEGEHRAEAGDWIMQGVSGELWPVPRDKALEKYDPI